VIRFWNRGAIRIFGFTAEEAIGASLAPDLDAREASIDPPGGSQARVRQR
jgi:PAS domain-containing protein